MIYKKWRESIIDIGKLPLKEVTLEKIISYPPAGNDVWECLGKYHGKNISFFVKSERGKFANFENEVIVLNRIYNILPVPKVLESGKYNGHTYIVLNKINGDKLSDIINCIAFDDRLKYLYNYGKMLGYIHKIKLNCDMAYRRSINDIPSISDYNNLDDWSLTVIDFLKEKKPRHIISDTFIHGDFHYGNVLFFDFEVSGVLDWEYSGLGFKEQDIAWSLILRPTQTFMKTKYEIQSFLEGYKSENNFNLAYLKWCLINGSLHFYLMNINTNNKKYLNYLKEQIEEFIISFDNDLIF